MDPISSINTQTTQPKRSGNRWFLIILGALLLSGLGYGAVQLTQELKPTAPAASPAPPVTSTERNQVSDSPLRSTRLEVTELVSQISDIGAGTAKSLQVSGDVSLQSNLTVNGNGTFGGVIAAANFQGGGAGLTGVNASFLGGQPRSYYEGLVSTPANVALRDAANTFTAANTFAAPAAFGVVSAGATTITSLTLSSALTIGSGGTGLSSVANQGVLFGQGGASLGVAVPGGSGECLLSTVTAVQWAACPGGGGGVTSLNSQTGAVTLANATAAGGTVTINNASGAAKGIASFNTTNFSVSAGAVNTIQNIDTTATPTFAGLNVNTITPSGALTVGAVSQSFLLRGTAASTITATNGGNTTTLSFATPTGNRAIVLPDEAGTVCLQNSVNCGFSGGSGSFINNSATLQTNANIAIQSANDSDTTLLLKNRAAQSADILKITDNSNNMIFKVTTFGSAQLSGPVEFQSYAGLGLAGAATNGAALNMYTFDDARAGIVINGNGGQTGDMIRLNSQSTQVFTVTASGALVSRNAANSSAAFEVQRANAAPVLTVDTSAAKVIVAALDVTANLTINGHIVTAGSAPGIAAGTAACTSPTVSVSGTDTAGLITVTTGTSCGATGKLAGITFNTAFGAAPRVTLTPAETNAAGLTQTYVNSGTISASAFDLSTNTAPANTTTYKWYYHAIQ